MQFIWYIIGY